MVTEGREGLPGAVDEGFDEFEPLGDFFGGETGFMVHGGDPDDPLRTRSSRRGS